MPGADLFTTPNSYEQQRRGLDSTRGYAALYAPWLRVSPDNNGPPISYRAAMCAASLRAAILCVACMDLANEIVNGSLGVERRISLIEQGQLNLQGINVMRVFQGGGRPIVWGARTTASDNNWQYVNIRRLFLFLGIDPGGHSLGGVRAEQPGAMGKTQAHDPRLSSSQLARGRVVRCQGRGRVLCAHRRGAQSIFGAAPGDCISRLACVPATRLSSSSCASASGRAARK